MRDRSPVTDEPYFQSSFQEPSNCGLSSFAVAFDSNVDALYSGFNCLCRHDFC